MPSSLPEFKQLQYAFTAHIRNPEKYPAPDNIEARRMDIYSQLFYNNIEGFISSAFPVLRKITTDTNWQKMIRGFIENHQSKTPYFLEISQEFMLYLKEERPAQPQDYPFMQALTHYEWLELKISVQETKHSIEDIDPNGDLLDNHPIVAETVYPVSYQYPVHKIGPDFLPTKTNDEITHLVVYRDRIDEVHFLEINAVTAKLLQLLIEQKTLTGTQALNLIAQELNHPDPNTVIKTGSDILLNLKEKNIILGTI